MKLRQAFNLESLKHPRHRMEQNENNYVSIPFSVTVLTVLGDKQTLTFYMNKRFLFKLVPVGKETNFLS